MEKKLAHVGNIPLAVFVLDNGDWVLSDEMASVALGVSIVTIRRHFQRHKNDLVKGRDWVEIRCSRHWTMDGVVRLGNFVKQKKAGDLLDALGVKSRHVTRIESNAVGILSAALADILQFQLQHQIVGYKVDIYIPSLNLAIEIDEHGHGSYNPIAEVLREFVITKRLDCELIRWNAHAPGANIGTLLNEILKRLVASTTSGNETQRFLQNDGTSRPIPDEQY